MKFISSTFIVLSFSSTFCVAQDLQTVTDHGNITNHNIVINAGQTTPASSGNATGSLNVISGPGSASLSLGIFDTGSLGSQYGWLQTAYNNAANYFGNLSLNPLGGNLGIGTTNPQAMLQLGNFGNTTNNSIVIPGTYNFEQIKLGEIGNGNSALEFINHRSLTQSYGVRFLIDVDHGAPGLQMQYAAMTNSYSSLAYNTSLYMASDGSISVGTLTHPAGYKFAVGGNMIAESVTVKQQANWPDYVFSNKYALPELKTVKTYIDRYHRLPAMPSAVEITQNGVDIGKMLKLQQQKIEELTLYLIEKDKELKAQNIRLEKLEKKLKKM